MDKKNLTRALGTSSPVLLALVRDRDKNLFNKFRRIFRESIILFPALYFMLSYSLIDYLITFVLLFIAVYSTYEIGYIYNDFIRVEYDEKPTIRPYVGLINAKIASAIRIVYIILIGVLLREMFLSYVVSLCILIIAIVNHNLIKRKIDKIVADPFIRISKYMFIPIAISNLKVDIIASSLMMLLPLVLMDAESTAVVAIKRYEEIKTSLAKPYYIWFLTFLPFQILLLLKYSPLIFTGELLLIIISVVRHK